MANEGYHEPIKELKDETRDMHRAITSLMEELEAVDWYNQRVDACKDKELKAILAHNRPPSCINIPLKSTEVLYFKVFERITEVPVRLTLGESNRQGN